MSLEITQEAPAYQCRHIFTDGHRCGSRALRQENFCYYHHTTRGAAANTSAAAHPPAPADAFSLPLPEDRSAIQHAIGQVLQRIAGNRLDPRRAGLLLYGLQIAALNLPRNEASNASAPLTVDEVTLDPTHGPIAPVSELEKAPHEKTLEEILMEQWERDEQEFAARAARDATPATLPLLQAVAAPQPSRLSH